MPILKCEQDLYPGDLLEWEEPADSTCEKWYAIYTRSRCEKKLMRKLCKLEVPFYSPTIPHRYRSPAGRLRVSHDLLFKNYVFIYGDEFQRHAAQDD